jgi:hypothetical protein
MRALSQRWQAEGCLDLNLETTRRDFFVVRKVKIFVEAFSFVLPRSDDVS